MSLLGLAPSITVLAILLLVMGVSSTMFHVPGPVMIKKVSGELTGRGMSFFMFGGELARTIGPLIILGGVSLWGLEGTYKLIPLGVVATVILYFKLRKIRIAGDFSKNDQWSGISRTLRKHLPLFLILMGMTFFRSVMKSALTTFLPTYMNLKGESLWMGGISLSILELAGAIGTLFIGSYSDKIGRKTVLLIISIAAPLLMWLFTISGKPFELPFLVLLGFFLFGFTPVVLALIQDRATERPAFLNGIYMTISFGMGALAVLLVGALSDWIGMDLTFRISAFLSLGAIPFVLMLIEKPKS
jgi:FSR family fosmidomycin resistance protein-like MFS transporter